MTIRVLFTAWSNKIFPKVGLNNNCNTFYIKTLGLASVAL